MLKLDRLNKEDKSVTETDSEDRRPKKSGLREFLSFAVIILMALVFAFLIITYVFRSYAVDGASMETTLHNNDKLIIWKVPRTWARITGNQYVPPRGDIIVFEESNLSGCGQDSSRQLIKRVIGLPGDKVVIKNGVVTIYDKQHPNGFQPDKQLPYGKTTNIPSSTPNETIQLNSHQLFVMGDNRTVSCDSRVFGPIDTNQVIGQLVIRLLPLSNVEVF